jgi:hypothetical protein
LWKKRGRERIGRIIFNGTENLPSNYASSKRNSHERHDIDDPADSHISLDFCEGYVMVPFGLMSNKTVTLVLMSMSMLMILKEEDMELR